jgi:ParB family chromosome partitioning protein
LVTVTHRLLTQTIYGESTEATESVQVTVQLDKFSDYGPDVQGCKAQREIDQGGDVIRSELPADPDALFGWLLQQPQEKLLQLLAYCVARSLNGVSAEEESHRHDALVAATGLDMREWWSASGGSYFASVPKSRILEVLRETVSPEVVGALSNLKKGELIQAAEQRLAGAGWLPGLFRQQAA